MLVTLGGTRGKGGHSPTIMMMRTAIPTPMRIRIFMSFLCTSILVSIHLTVAWVHKMNAPPLGETNKVVSVSFSLHSSRSAALTICFLTLLAPLLNPCADTARLSAAMGRT
jgi:hypothetical protein